MSEVIDDIGPLRRDVAEYREAPPAVNPTPAQMLQTALERGMDAQMIKELMDMKYRWESDEARKAYASAMVRAQASAKKVVAKAYNDQTKSKYADIGAVADAVVPALSEQGIALSFYEGETPKEGHVRVCCDITHELGHVVTRHIDMPIVTTGTGGKTMMTLIHATGSAMTYGRRYLTLMIANVKVGDDDGQGAGVDTVTPEQAKILKDLLAEVNGDTVNFLKACGSTAPSVDELPARMYAGALLRLQARKAKLEKALEQSLAGGA